MKKIFISIFLAYFFTFGLFCSPNFGFSLMPEISLMNGTIHEYVYDDYNTNTDNLESRLDWDVKNIPVLNIYANATLFRYLSVQGGFSYGIPKNSGFMQDYDWLNSITTGWLTDEPTELTNYSKHTNSLDSYYSFYAGLGANFVLEGINVRPFARYEYSYISFTGTDGYKSYKSDSYAKVFMSGKVIGYTVAYDSVLLGFDFNKEFNQRFTLDGTLAFSPNLTFASDLDKHFAKSTAYYDKFTNAFLFKFALGGSFNFNQYHKIYLSGKLTYMPVIKGKDYSAAMNEDGKLTSSLSYAGDSIHGGTSRFLWSVDLGYTFTL